MNRPLYRIPALVLLLLAGPPLARAQVVTDADVQNAIERARAFIVSRQAADGSFPFAHTRYSFPVGATALAAFALLTAGDSVDDPVVAGALEYVATHNTLMTYSLATKILALVTADPERYADVIRACIMTLAHCQLPDGSWTYAPNLPADDRRRTKGDNSQTQMAVLALATARDAGFAVPRGTLTGALDHFKRTQGRDGGWVYMSKAEDSRGSMTAAGVATWLLVEEHLFGEVEQCGRYRTPPEVVKAMRWLDTHFSVTDHPGNPGTYHYYYLYSLERAGVLSGRRYFGGHDWFREGAEFLVRSQNADGSWGPESLYKTCFAMLFLAKGRAPVLFGKLKWKGEWNVHIHDVLNLAKYVSDELDRKFGWEVIDASAPVAEWLRAPIILVSGRTELELSEPERKSLLEYMDNGGTLLFMGNCGRKEFGDAFKTLFEEMLPGRVLRKLGGTSPVYHARYDVTDLRPLWALASGCRESLFYCDEDLGWAWEQDDPAGQASAFRLGINLATYVMGHAKLRDKLQSAAPLRGAEGRTPPPAPGAFQPAQIKYAGEWETDRKSLAHLLEFLRTNAGMDVAGDKRAVELTSPDLFNYPFLYMTGHHAFSLSDEQKARLKKHITSGGMLWAEACCGREEFDKSFRELMKELFPDNPLTKVPPDDPLYHIAFDLEKVSYTPAVQRRFGDYDELPLEGVFLGIRWAVVYSKFNLGCSLAGHGDVGNLSVASDDAFKLATNIVVYFFEDR